MKRSLLFTLILLIVRCAMGQGAGYTDVSGTFLPYANGSVSASFVNQSGQPQLPLLNGSVFQQNAVGNFDSFGNFNLFLADNGIVLPSPSQWKITACGKGGSSPPCCSTTMTISGSSQSITSFLNGCPTSGGGGGGGLNTSVSFVNQTIVNVSAATIGASNANIVTQCFDTSGSVMFPQSIVVDPVTYGVTVTFAVPQSGSCVFNTSSGSGSGSGGIPGLQIVGLNGITNIQAAVNAAGVLGSVLIPSTYGGTDTWTNPESINIMDLRNGGQTASTGMSFGNPRDMITRYDNTTTGGGTTVGCGGTSASGLGDVAPVEETCLFEGGSTTAVTRYDYAEYLPSYHGFGAVTGTNIKFDPGSGPSQVIGPNITVADNHGLPITSCTSTASIATCTVTGSLGNYAPGSGFWINGNTGPFNSQTGVWVATAVNQTAGTVTFDCSAVSCGTASGTGGHLAGNTEEAFSMELNQFNNSWDPIGVSPTINQNVAPWWGYVSTTNGTYPGTAGFFNDGPWYVGFLCGDAKQACFKAGNPLSSGDNQGNAVGFDNSPKCLATSGLNCPSKEDQYEFSYWNGTNYVVTSYFTGAFPATGTNPNSSWDIVDPTGNHFWKFMGQQIVAPGGSVASPVYTFSADTTSGLLRDAGGQLDLVIGGTTRTAITSSGPVAQQFTATASPLSVAAGQIGYGGSTAAASFCNGGGSISGVAGCIVVNIGGTTHYVPYF